MGTLIGYYKNFAKQINLLSFTIFKVFTATNFEKERAKKYCHIFWDNQIKKTSPTTTTAPTSRTASILTTSTRATPKICKLH